MTRQIQWGRVLVGGLLAELLVLAVGFPVRMFLGESAFLTADILTSGLAPFFLMLWVGRRVKSHFVLHGALVGLVAALVHIAFAAGQSQPATSQVAYGMKLLGGAVGGFIAFRIQQRGRV